MPLLVCGACPPTLLQHLTHELKLITGLMDVVIKICDVVAVLALAALAVLPVAKCPQPQTRSSLWSTQSSSGSRHSKQENYNGAEHCYKCSKARAVRNKC